LRSTSRRNPYSHRPGIRIHNFPEHLFTCPGIRTKIERLRKQAPASRFFIIFQAPPTESEEGFRRYRWYAQAMTPIQSLTTESRVAVPETSYEVFGFDSYLLALGLLEYAKSREPSAVATAMGDIARAKPAMLPDPFLLLGPYRFSADGTNLSASFHLYEFKGGMLKHSDDLCPSDSVGTGSWRSQ
jgi:hypothetical protein